eukprot:353923-Prymnesium_polylepis.2
MSSRRAEEWVTEVSCGAAESARGREGGGCCPGGGRGLPRRQANGAVVPWKQAKRAAFALPDP